MRTVFEVVEGHLVGGDHASTGARLNGHVADGHAGFHGQFFNGFATVLNNVPLAAAGTNLGDNGQNQILRCDPVRQLAGHVDGHSFERFQRQRLGGHHMLHLGGANTEGNGTERAVGCGVGIATDHGHARLGQPQLRTDNMHNALFNIAHGMDTDTKFFSIFAQGFHLGAGNEVINLRDGTSFDTFSGDVVVFCGQGEVGAS